MKTIFLFMLSRGRTGAGLGRDTAVEEARRDFSILIYFSLSR